MTKKEIKSLADLVSICKKYNMFTVVLHWNSREVNGYLPTWTKLKIEKQQDESKIRYMSRGTSGGGLGLETHFCSEIDLTELVDIITEDIPSDCIYFTITAGIYLYDIRESLLKEITDIRDRSVMEYLKSRKII